MAEPVAEEVSDHPQDQTRQRGSAARHGDREAQDKNADRRASHSKASTASRAQASSRNPILDDSMHPIRPHDIPRGVWTVLLRLRGAGVFLFKLHCSHPRDSFENCTVYFLGIAFTGTVSSLVSRILSNMSSALLHRT